MNASSVAILPPSPGIPDPEDIMPRTVDPTVPGLGTDVGGSAQATPSGKEIFYDDREVYGL
jgi:hypothetical protein